MSSQGEVVLITGSSGLIGSAAVNRLAADFRVVGFDRDGPPHPPAAAECVCVDLTSEESLQAGLARVRYAYGETLASVVHLAAYYSFSGEPSPLYEEITVRGTERLLQGLKDFQVGQFVFSSTMLVHAPCEPGQTIDEDWPLTPKWDYPRSKLQTEELIRARHGNVPIVLLRIAGVYTDRCQSIPLAHQIQRIYERRLTSRVYPGDISRGQAFLHLDDLLDALSRVVERRERLPAESVMLLGEPETLSYGELQRRFGLLIHGEEWETREIPKTVAKTGAWLQDVIPGEEPFIKPWMVDLADDHYALNVSRARTLLGWEPQRSLRETLPRMIEALEADPPGWYRENRLETPPSVEIAQQEAAEPRHPRHAEQGGGGTGGHRQMTLDMRRKWLWTNFTVMGLGAWLMTSPATFGYTSAAMTWSDVASGALLAFLAALALFPRFDFAGRWGVALAGTWLQAAPLVFWAPDAAAYMNDTLIGALAIALSILVPMMPGMAHHEVMMQPGPEIPPGWSYNPSSWHQRAPMIALALVGWFISRYLAAFQLGYIHTAWEPFFGGGTTRVLTSEVSKMWPVSDAGLGAFAYTFEMLMGWMGGRSRWRTMPWMVTFFFLLVVPLGLTHVVLVILQPVVVGAWCTLCLAAAFLMLLMIPLTVDEVVAMGQFLARSVREGKPFWRTFWIGGTVEGGGPDRRTPRYGSPPAQMFPPTVWGVTASRNLMLCAAIGIWLMFAPAIFGTQGRAADSDHLAGALVLTVAVISMAEVFRAGRFLNVLLGAWIAAAPWLLAGFTGGARWSGLAAGLAVILLSLRRGAIRERYAGWDRYAAWPGHKTRRRSS
jgi:nucleoside-diphosphate-sugar epimerase